jgi:NAD(P)-dependent dehydrogenase (short-subunit alcohol dehydrogenase family)
MTTVDLKPVEEQVVALIGTSSGISRETALWFAKRGARVVVSSLAEAAEPKACGFLSHLIG